MYQFFILHRILIIHIFQWGIVFINGVVKKCVDVSVRINNCVLLTKTMKISHMKYMRINIEFTGMSGPT